MQSKDNNQHQAQPEVRHGGTEQSENHACGILPGVLVDSGVDTQRNGYQSSNNNSSAAQIQGVRQILEEGMEYVLVGYIGFAHITYKHTSHIVKILQQERLVQTKLMANLINHFFEAPSPAIIIAGSPSVRLIAQ